MLRISELVLALSPVALLAVLWALAYRRLPSRRAVAAMAVGMGAYAALLAWQGTYGTLTPHQRYVPAQLQDGRVVEGHGG